VTEREIILSGGIVCYARKYRRARNMRIIIRKDGSVRLSLPFFVPYRVGEIFLRSRETWIKERLATLPDEPDDLLLRGSKEEYREQSGEARTLIEARLAHFQSLYGVVWQRVSIRNQKTRWGSCSRSGNLSFNYRLVYLPERLRDYVVVHELCHLLAFDHSPRFWALVERVFPDYRELRTRLRLL
jgi:predicted metal-dependent hydrolase